MKGVRNDPTGERRLSQRVRKEGECLRWTGVHIRTGYGRISIGGVRVAVHRAAYELAKGPIPEGMEIDHLCRVRDCVNPEHLEAVTHHENQRRKPGVGAHCGFLIHPKTAENTRSNSNGSVWCRTCEQAWKRVKIPCPDCGKLINRSGMSRHAARKHGGGK